MTDAKIEIASASDLAQILTLQKLAYLSEAELYGDYSLPPLKQSYEEIKKDFRKQLFLKAVNDGNLVGSVRAFEKEGICYIGRLIVDPKYQNKGLGSQLLQTIEASFPRSTRYELFTGNKSMKNLYLYKKLGYEIFRQHKVSDSLTLIFLRKDRTLTQQSVENGRK